MGASKFGEKILEALIDDGVGICGVITNERTFSISYSDTAVENVNYADIGKLAEENKIPQYCMQKHMLEEQLCDFVIECRPRIFVVAGWYHMVPKKLREMAPAYGLHASLLPKYSGGAPLVWAIIEGASETGITFFQMDSGVDSGPIVGQLSTNIRFSDDIASLYSRMETLGCQLVREYTPRLLDGTAVHQEQDNSFRTTYPQRCPEDGLILWNQTDVEMIRFVRAQTRPYGGAFTFFGSEKVNVWSADISPSKVLLKIGEFKLFDGNLVVGTKQGNIVVTDYDIQFESGLPDQGQFRVVEKEA